MLSSKVPAKPWQVHVVMIYLVLLQRNYPPFTWKTALGKECFLNFLGMVGHVFQIDINI